MRSKASARARAHGRTWPWLVIVAAHLTTIANGCYRTLDRSQIYCSPADPGCCPRGMFCGQRATGEWLCNQPVYATTPEARIASEPEISTRDSGSDNQGDSTTSRDSPKSDAIVSDAPMQPYSDDAPSRESTGGVSGQGDGGATWLTGGGAGNIGRATSTAGSSGSSGVLGTGGSGGGTNGTGGTMGSGGLYDAGGAIGTDDVVGIGGLVGSGGATGLGGAPGNGGTTGVGGSIVNLIDEVAKTADAQGQNGLDGLLWTSECATPDASGADTCGTFVPCTAGGGKRISLLQLGGDANTGYEIQMIISGIAEGKVYQDGLRASGTSELSNTSFANNGWYVGGIDVRSLWQVFSLTVTPPPGQPTVYYLNSGLSQSYAETHDVFAFKYQASIKVMGQSRIIFTLLDANCVQIQNCGIPRSMNCGSHASLSLMEFADPPPPATFKQPYVTGPVNYPQWWFFDVTSVAALN